MDQVEHKRNYASRRLARSGHQWATKERLIVAGTCGHSLGAGYSLDTLSVQMQPTDGQGTARTVPTQHDPELPPQILLASCLTQLSIPRIIPPRDCRDQALADQDYATATADAFTKADTTQVLAAHECQAEVLRHEYIQALTDCASAAQGSSSGSGAYDGLAEANLALGNPGVALTVINQAINNFIGSANAYTQTAGVDGFGLSNLLAAKGWIQIQLGETQAAVDTFNQALNALPGPAPDTRARIKA
jgi:hypothetical protein